jgi:hypothetical protein
LDAESTDALQNARRAEQETREREDVAEAMDVAVEAAEDAADARVEGRQASRRMELTAPARRLF